MRLDFGEPPVAKTGVFPPFSVRNSLSVAIDTETTGLKRTDDAVGVSVATEHGSMYFPFAHLTGGGNLPKERVSEWLDREIRDADVYMCNAPFDIERIRRMGVDLLEPHRANRIHEIQHSAAVADPRITSLKLNEIAMYFGMGEKLRTQGHVKDLWRKPAADAAPYAVRDAELTLALGEHTRDVIWNDDDMSRIYKLENALLPHVVRMERHGIRIDVNKLAKKREMTTHLIAIEQARLYHNTGRSINVNSNPSLTKAFEAIGYSSSQLTDSGNQSWDKIALANAEKDDDPKVRGLAAHVVKIRALQNLMSRYFDKYPNHIEGDRIYARFSQMRADWEDGSGGTITGRFSSSDPNLQQVKHGEIHGIMVRDLFLPDDDEHEFVNCDMSAAEFRLFAHFSGDADLIAEYNRDNPDFHQFVAGITGLPRKQAKNVNFARLYGGGVNRIRDMVGCDLETAERIVRTYDRKFPIAKRMLKLAENLAKKRGYVKTIWGRRRYYAEGDRFYSGLNSVIQGSCADIMKLAMLRAGEEQQSMGYDILATVHDSLMFSAPRGSAERIGAMLREPLIPDLKVPMRWDVSSGADWGACDG